MLQEILEMLKLVIVSKYLVVDRWGEDQIRRFTVSGIAKSPGGQGFDYNAVIHIDTLRDMMKRQGDTGSFMVKLNDPYKAFEVKEFFLTYHFQMMIFLLKQ